MTFQFIPTGLLLLLLLLSLLLHSIDYSSASKPNYTKRHSNSNHSRKRKTKKMKEESISTEQLAHHHDNDDDDNDDDDDDVVDGAINEKKRLYDPDNPKMTHPLHPLNNNINISHNNKFKSNFHASQNIPHHLHAMIGLDRYPNYLSRWSMEDIEELETSMELRLQQVREQKQMIQMQRQSFSDLMKEVVHTLKENHNIHENDDNDNDNDDNDDNDCNENLVTLLTPPSSWSEIQESILDPQASKAIFGSKWFQNQEPQPPTVEQVLSGKVNVSLDASLLEGWMDQEMFDVYSFPLLSPEFSERIKQFVQQIQKVMQTNSQFQNYNQRRPFDLDNVGLGWINTLLFQLIIKPISKHLFQDTEINGALDWRQGYVNSYVSKKFQSNPSQQRQHSGLVPHTDDSEVTLNLCLGNHDFVGGKVRFSGLRGTRQEGIVLGEFEPKVGTAILHAGRHLHEVTEVEYGNRFAYIVWARSWGGIRSFTCPCCWLTRRGGSSSSGRRGRERGCICAPQWN